ncbi:hypothetical protein QUF70_16100 [Desulfobacterales bacterium HSG17]|nr:hypothetical protein [Desulfobacterales bacterium HSG17]
MDVPGIKKYVFGTDRLVEIRGASALLAQLNEKDTPVFFEKKLGKDNFECVFSGGGAGQFIITADDNSLAACMNELHAEYIKKSKGGLSFIYGAAEYNESDYAACLDRAFIELKRKKDEEPVIPCSLLHTGFIRECDSCSDMGSQYSKYAEETKLLCDICVEKVEFGKGKGLWKKFSDFLEKKIVNADSMQMPKTFEEIGNCCQSRKGYTALVYADGNAMGKIIKNIENKDQFKTFSKTVNEAITLACHEALYEKCNPVQRVIPANILLLGGDDLMVYLSADNALEFAIDAAQRFNEKTREMFSKDAFFSKILKDKGLTVSLGIAYGKSHTPFSLLFSQAEELLKSSKRAGSNDQSAKDFFAPSYIDFHISSQFNQLKVSQSRNDHLHFNSTKPVKLYQKPYSLAEAKSVLNHAQNLLNAKIPRTRLKRFGYVPFMDKMNGTLEFLKLYTRTRKGEQRMVIRKALEDFGCVPNMPWNEMDKDKHDCKECISTVLTDLIEIAEFYKPNKETGGGSDASLS